jgi:two-component system nitrate/nitrite response regulator NarL
VERSDPTLGPEQISGRRPQHLQRPRVLIADDHPVVRIGVRNLLAAHGSFSIVGEAETGDEAIELTLEHCPDLLLLDVQMPKVSGMDIIRGVVASAPQVRIVLLTGSIQSALLTEVFNLGVRGLVLKSSLPDQIAVALATVMEGYFWVHGRRIETLSGVLTLLRSQMRQENSDRFQLTRRELDVVGLIVKGLSNRDIAKQFDLSEETVKRHLSNIFNKLNISTRLELAIFAISHKLGTNTDKGVV